MDWGKIIEYRRAERISQSVPIVPSIPNAPILPESVLVFIPICVAVKLD